jgi:hypothetical protein
MSQAGDKPIVMILPLAATQTPAHTGVFTARCPFSRHFSAIAPSQRATYNRNA